MHEVWNRIIRKQLTANLSLLGDFRWKECIELPTLHRIENATVGMSEINWQVYSEVTNKTNSRMTEYEPLIHYFTAKVGKWHFIYKGANYLDSFQPNKKYFSLYFIETNQKNKMKQKQADLLEIRKKDNCEVKFVVTRCCSLNSKPCSSSQDGDLVRIYSWIGGGFVDQPWQVLNHKRPLAVQAVKTSGGHLWLFVGNETSTSLYRWVAAWWDVYLVLDQCGLMQLCCFLTVFLPKSW